jgi:predicted RecB family endonuclease
MTLEEYKQELETAAEKITDDMMKAVTELCLVIVKSKAFENEPELLRAAKSMTLKRIETCVDVIGTKVADIVNDLDL